MDTIVSGYGRLPNRVLLCGESPGYDEAKAGRPFVGKSGQEQEDYLGHHNLTPRMWYRTNVVKEYRGGNPDPTPDQVAEWTPTLYRELDKCRPEMIVAVGRFAARWFLGDDADMEMVHGLPHYAGALDPVRRDRGGPADAIIVPVYHPAAGLHNTDTRVPIDWDYGRVAEVYGRACRGEKGEIETPHDDLAGCEHYDDITGRDVAGIVAGAEVIAIDTEGSPGRPWSIQISTCPGTGYVLRASWSDFATGIRSLQEACDRGVTILMHNAMYDLEMCAAMGLDTYHARLYDTMYAAYITRREPQGLKSLAYRWASMRMASYQDTIGDVALSQQLTYLMQIAERPWPKPEPRLLCENDGRFRLYAPQKVERTVEGILSDYYSGKVDKDGKRTDPEARWGKVDRELREMVERDIGGMPTATLDDIPRNDAIYYSARDADATFRVWDALAPEMARRRLDHLVDEGGEIIPVYEEMQRTGMPASRRLFEKLYEDMDEAAWDIGRRISRDYWDGEPFNPGSSQQCAQLLEKRGLKATRKTKTGMPSTDKRSIEYLRFIDPAFAMVFDWREHRHIRDSFCTPALNAIPRDGARWGMVRCKIKITRTHTRRLASADPNLLAIPVRTDIGRRVRECYECPPGEVLGAWDFSQIEARFMAHESRDRLLIRLFQEDRDIHAETASMIFGIPLHAVDKMKHRLPAKNTLFGVIYGIAGPGLKVQMWKLDQTHWTDESCQEMIDEFMRVYKGVDRYIAEVVRKVRSQRENEVRDHWGMPRYLPAVRCREGKLSSEAERQAVSQKIQGGAQGMLRNAIIRLRPVVRQMQDEGIPVKWRLQVHDEINMSFPPGLWPRIDPIVRDAMVNHNGIDLRVPVKAEGAMSENWGGLK